MNIVLIIKIKTISIPVDSNPADEKFSACREARIRYKIKINPPKRTASPTAAVLEEFEGNYVRIY